MAPVEDDTNPYELLALKSDATDPEVRKAYRQRSLKVHPDRNPDNPDAARLFHELTQSYELLLDPLRRMALDAKLRLKEAKKLRFAAYDGKRKTLVAELEERERAFKKARTDKDAEANRRWKEDERVKDEGRRMREEREAALQRRDAEAKAQTPAPTAPTAEDDEPPEPGQFDTTVRLRYSLGAHPTLTTPAALASLLSPLGATDTASIVLAFKPAKPSKKDKDKDKEQKPQRATALVPFTQIGAAFAAVCASGRAARGLEGVDVAWAGGAEPALIGWLKRRGHLGAGAAVAGETETAKDRETETAKDRETETGAGRPSFQFASASTTKPTGSPFSSFPSSFPDIDLSSSTAPAGPAPTSSAIDYESLTLMRLRQAERDRLEREILEREAEEG